MDKNKKKNNGKKVVVDKSNSKSQIIINPPEKENPAPYKEQFLNALNKHRVSLEERTKIVLAAKSAQTGVPASVLEQVYLRGVKSLPDNCNLTHEQYAMNRVNSFIAGGAALKEDSDLIPIFERVGMKGTGGAGRPHIKREVNPYNRKIVFHVVDAKGRVKHTTTDEMAAKRHLASKYQSYMEMTENPAKRFEGTKSLVKTYKDDTPGEQKEEKMKGKDPCWKGYEMVGHKLKAGRKVPNCVPKNEEVINEGEGIVTPKKTRASFLPPAPGTYAADLAAGKYAKYGFTKSGKETAAAKRERMKKEEVERVVEVFRNRGFLGASAKRAFRSAELAHELGHEDRASSRPRRSYGHTDMYGNKIEKPHDVHINGKKWKTFGSFSHAHNVAKKIKGATVHVSEELTMEQMNTKKHVRSGDPNKSGTFERQPDGKFKMVSKLDALKQRLKAKHQK